MLDDIMDYDNCTGKYYNRQDIDSSSSDAMTSSADHCQQHGLGQQQQQQQNLRPGPRRRGLVVRIKRQGITFTRRLVKLLGLAEFRYLLYSVSQKLVHKHKNLP